MRIFHDSIPVLAYHQVSANNKITPELFAAQMRYLHENGYNTVTLDEFHSFLTGCGEAAGAKKRLLITFDDGFADNYTHAYPILKRYDFTAVIFLITSRITMSDEIRWNMDDVKSGLCRADELYMTSSSTKANTDSVIRGATEDFLTSAEIKKMSHDGVIEFGSHTHLHAKYFSDDRIVDFFNPESHWSVLFETGGNYDFGIPLYPMSSAVTARRYFDDRRLRDHLIEHVKREGGADYFVDKDYKKKQYMKKLLKVVEEHKAKYALNGNFESDDAFNKRVADDMMKSKEIIESITGKEADYLCWPWGDFSPRAVQAAKECGFKGLFSLQRGANSCGDDLDNIKRLEVKPKGTHWLNNRLGTYSSTLRSKVYGAFRR